MPIRILAVDGHDIVLLGLQTMFAATDIRLAATTISAVDALKKVGSQKPDVVLVEVRLEDGDGVGLLKRINSKHPSQPMAILSGYDSSVYLTRAFAAGYIRECYPPQFV